MITVRQSALNRPWRAALWLGFRVARLWWHLAKPRHEGALVALWWEGRVLVLHSSYRHHANLPGGGVKRGETARKAAVRELREETGVAATAGELQPVARFTVWWDGRSDTINLFRLVTATCPSLTLDGREIVGAAWLRADELGCLPPHLRQRLSSA